MNDQQVMPSRWGRGVFIVIGLLLLVSLPLIPWFSRGLKQSGTAKAVIAAGGRASYGKYLHDTADYVKDEKIQEKQLIKDVFGEAFVDKLTQVEVRKEIPDALVRRISRLPALEILDASNANLDDADMKRLAAAKGLKKLWINGSQVTAEGLRQLSELPNLMSLALDDTAIDDAALEFLVGHAELRRLYLANTAVSDAGIPKLTRLTKLLGIGLEGTKVSDQCLSEIARFPELEEVRLSDTLVSDDGVSVLSKLPKLKSLTLSNTKLTSAGLSWLPDCQSLEILDLAGTAVDDSVIDVVAEIPQLVSVSLRGTSVSDDAINQLKRRLGRGVTVQSDTGDTVLAN